MWEDINNDNCVIWGVPGFRTDKHYSRSVRKVMVHMQGATFKFL